MSVAVDSNVLIDVLGNDPRHGVESESRLRTLRAAAEPLIVGEAVIAEVAGNFPSPSQFDSILAGLGVRFVSSSTSALHRAGAAWRLYTSRRPDGLQCPACGARNGAPQCEGCGEPLRPRQHILADFLVGAHALEHADRLLTRDRGFYAAYFPELRLA
ncbi:MAG: nucleotide-binding protein [Dehalococcoidia bacterium]|nr:nucleotide-binding protein [Dehalococcoidia bacterium]